jgi:fimbrial chaperone protein
MAGPLGLFLAALSVAALAAMPSDATILAAAVTTAASITPVIVDVPDNGRAIVTIRNERAREVLYQATIWRWKVVDGKDRYVATEDFIASPPAFTLAPGASQIVRIGMRSPALSPVEQTYRLALAEVPRPDAAREEGGVVEFALQYLLPVFVAPTRKDTAPALAWSLRREGHDTVIRVENQGHSRKALNAVGLSRQPGADPQMEYASAQRQTVLAGTWREWRIPVPDDRASSAWRILVVTDGSALPQVVPDADIRTSSVSR